MRRLPLISLPALALAGFVLFVGVAVISAGHAADPKQPGKVTLLREPDKGIQPQVAVINNGPRKGLRQVDNTVKSMTPAGKKTAPYERNGYARLASIPGIEGIWQGHLSLLDKDPKHNTSENMIGNFEETSECKGNWITASVERDGKFTIVNGRNGFSKTYTAR